MSISTATPQQLKELDDYTVMLRGLSGEWMRLMHKMNLQIDAWNATISAIIGTPGNLPVTDSSNLVGAVPLVDTEVYAISGWMQDSLTAYYDASHQQILVKACGPANVT